MMRRKSYLLTMGEVLLAAILLIIFMQMNVQAVMHKRFYLGPTHGSFSSPNYPRPYPGGIYYEWLLPMTSKELQIEFIELDLYNCYVKKNNRYCELFDNVYIKGQSYCNWNRPPKTITFLPWTGATIAFYSSQSSSSCKGRGFKVEYRPVGAWYKTNTQWPTTTTTATTTTTISSTKSSAKSADAASSARMPFSTIAILILTVLLLAVPVMLVCLYCCCRGRRSRPTVNQELLEIGITNLNYLPSYTDRPHQRQTDDGTIAHDSPPSYDEVLENDNSQSFESPPSYEAAMRESNKNLSAHQETENVDDTERNNNILENVQTLNLESNTS